MAFTSFVSDCFYYPRFHSLRQADNHIENLHREIDAERILDYLRLRKKDDDLYDKCCKTLVQNDLGLCVLIVSIGGYATPSDTFDMMRTNFDEIGKYCDLENAYSRTKTFITRGNNASLKQYQIKRVVAFIHLYEQRANGLETVDHHTLEKKLKELGLIIEADI